jgi:hypothetical protein
MREHSIRMFAKLSLFSRGSIPVNSSFSGVATGRGNCNDESAADTRWKNRLLVVSAPPGDIAASEQRKIYETASKGMSERQILLIEALGDSDRTKQVRSWLSADGQHFQVFLVGKDGHTALSSQKRLSAEYIFGKVDAMPMRRDEMRRAQ